ncbi:ATPase [Candidatus Magnetoovum chiemensis]|nr:ATPase [Candidatus Magnetoovum chiemensis]
MEEHGGLIRCSSEVNKGSTFTLYFPYQADEDAQKQQCWDFMECGRECDIGKKCPAYPHYGRICWAIAGTYCDGKTQGSYAQKIDNCKMCKFYKTLNKS